MKMEEMKSKIVESKQTWKDVLAEMGYKPDDKIEDGVLIIAGDRKQTKSALVGNSRKGIEIVMNFDFDNLRLNLMSSYLKAVKDFENGGNEDATIQ